MDSIAAAIDYLLVRYKPGASTAEARANCLRYLQAGEADAWSAGPWWFKQRELEMALTAGERLYTVANFSAVMSLAQDGGLPAQRVSVVEYDHVFLADATGGALVLFWCERPGNSEGLVRISVWPAPLANGSAVLTGDAAVRVLEDSTVSVSGFPEAWRSIPLLYAQERLAELDGQLEYAVKLRGDRETRLGELRVANAARPMQGA